MSATRLRVLIVEDRISDADMLVLELRRAGFICDYDRVDTEADYLKRLEQDYDLILSDYQLPQFDGLRALELAQGRGSPIPFIIVSGAIGEDTAVQAMRQGAADYLLKDRLTRIGPAVTQALEKARLHRDRERAEESIRLANERYRALAARSETIREQERTAVAREIHDVLAQELTRLKIDLVWVGKRLTHSIDEQLRGAMLERMTDATAQADVAIQTVQRIATELRPVVLDSLGLPAATEWQTEEFARRTGLTAAVAVPQGPFALDRERSTALFRILQESLTNIARHAGASSVLVRLSDAAGELLLTVKDDGRGITAEEAGNPRSIGLVGMSERAEAFGGTVNVAGSSGAGTTVTVRIPRGRPAS